MPFQPLLSHAQALLAEKKAALTKARDEYTAARREVLRLDGKARTPEQVQANRLSQRRAQVLRSHPKLRAIPNKARRREAVDQVLAARDAARVWKVYMDDMIFDTSTRTYQIFRRNRKRYALYKAAVTLGATLLREQAAHQRASGSGVVVRSLESADNARTLELHLQSLVDVSPREVLIHYPSEWRVISSALRPEGSNPKGKGARKLLALYQHIIRTHREEDA